MTLWALLLAAAPAQPAATSIDAFPTARAAFEQVLRHPPTILAVGEYHEVEGRARKVKSAIKRFTVELLPVLEGRASALVVETWLTRGACGQVEKVAVAAVKKATARPDSTEDEVSALLGRAYDLGLKNHTLLITCDEYRGMVTDAGELDGERSLLLVRRKVQAKAEALRDDDEAGVPGKPLVLYGGALHNDLRPADGLEDFSFGPALDRLTDGGYVELDLLVPEYVERDDELLKEPWFAPALALSGKGKAVLVTLSPQSFVLLFPRSR